MTLIVSDFRIFANSANKRPTTVTRNQILTQKWFLLQNMKDSSYFRNGVFNNGECTYACAVGTALLPVWLSFGKKFQI
jgi:hypothetical protein